MKYFEFLVTMIGNSGDQLTNDQIQDYLVYLVKERKLSWKTCNVAFCALQCFYGKFLGRTYLKHRLILNAFSEPFQSNQKPI
jgi:hypothetical protein